MIELIGRLRDGDYFYELLHASEIADFLETAAVAMVEQHMTSEELERISDAADQWSHHLTDKILNAVNDAIRHEIDNVGTVVEEMDSQSTLNSHIDTIEKLSKRVGIGADVVSSAVETVRDRITELEREIEVSKPPSFQSGRPPEKDTFDDEALKNLFVPLLQR